MRTKKLYTTLIAITTTIIQNIKTTNLISQLPEKLYIYKDDIVGFDMKDLINGTQSQYSIFPLQSSQKLKILKLFSHLISQITDYAKKPLKGILQISTSSAKMKKKLAKVTFIRVNSLMKTDMIIELDLTTQSEKPDYCSSVKFFKSTIFVCCYVLDEQKNYDLRLYSIEMMQRADKSYYLSVTDVLKEEDFIDKSLYDGTDELEQGLDLDKIDVSDDVIRIAVYQLKMIEIKAKVSDQIAIIDYDLNQKS